jgi:hypothetical protein
MSGVLIAVGGGVLGAGINSFIVRKFERDLLRDVRDIIARTLQARFLSDDRDIARYRGSWHHYYLTELDGNPSWWYEHYSFEDPAVGSITQRTALRDSHGAQHSYLIELGVRGDRLILVSSREDRSEASGVEVFPLPRGFQHTHAGIVVLEAWDSSQVLSKVILSKDQLIPDISEGRVPDEHSATLHTIWKARLLSCICHAC